MPDPLPPTSSTPISAPPPAGLTARISLKLLAPLALVLPVLLIVGMIGGVVYVQGKQTAVMLAIRGVEQGHRRIDSRLQALLDGPPRWNRLVRSYLDSGELNPDDLHAWRSPLYQQRHAFHPALGGVCWGDRRGHATWVFRYPDRPGWKLGIKDAQTSGQLEEYPLNADGALRGPPSARYDYDPRIRPWYQLGETAGEAGAWGEPYAWVNGDDEDDTTLGLPFASAVYDEHGTVRGVIDTELSLADISGFLRELPIGQSGLALVMDQGGRLIATSTGARLVDGELERIAAADSEDPDIRAVAQRLAEQFPGGAASLPGGWNGSVQLDRGPALMSVTRNKRPGRPDWLMMTAIPLADFIGDFDAIRDQAIRIVLAAVGLTLLLGMALAAWLVRPMLRVAHHARRVGAGDLDTPLALNQAREFVELSHEFNGMTTGLRERMSMRRSLQMASEVQKNLLPDTQPTPEGFDIAGHCNYCDETGGDYYDYLEDSETQEAGTSVVIGDVMGHGIAAAMLMATARGVLRSHSRTAGRGIAELLTHLNHLLSEVTGGQRFMTMLIVNLDAASRALRWASAGHDAPMIYHPDTDTFHEPEGGGLPLGVVPDETYEAGPVETLPPGAVVLVATDGMWETRDPAGQMHGKDRLHASIRRHASKPAAEIRSGLLQDLHAFRGDAPQDDDETFVVIKVTG